MKRFRMSGIIFALFTLCHQGWANNTKVIKLVLYNYTQPGTVFLGASPPLFGPSIGTNGASVQWTPPLSGKQQVGIQVGSTRNVCYESTGKLILNAALYTGDTITVIYGQPQLSPPGVACGCQGSACAIG